MKTDGLHFPPGCGPANLVMTGGQGREEEKVVGEEKEEEEKEGGEDGGQIGELFRRAELGHPFGYRRVVNLLMDIICDRLSSRLCHRCVRQTSYPTCPRLAPSEGESCQCQKSDGTGPNLGKLVQGREQITQTTSNRCDSCSVTLCSRVNTKGTLSKPPHDFLIPTKHINDGVLRFRDGDHPDSDLLPSQSRRIRFLKNSAFLEDKIRQGMAEKARTFAQSSSKYKPPASSKFETERPYQFLHTDNIPSFSMPNDKHEKPVYVKGTNPLLDKMKFELQNDEETKHEFARMYQEDYTPSSLPPSVFETPVEFENKTVGATRHSNASPADLLRKRLSRNNNGRKSAVDGDLGSRTKWEKHIKIVENNERSREITGSELEDAEKHAMPLEIDPAINRQLMSCIPRAAAEKTGRYNALIGFADKMSIEAATEGTPYKSNQSLLKQTHEPPGEKIPSPIPVSIPAQPYLKGNTNIKPDSVNVEDRGIQAIPSAHQAQTQTHDNTTSEKFTSQQEAQTEIIGPGIRMISSFETGYDCQRIHADVCTQTSKSSQQSLRQHPFSLNMWTQTAQYFPNSEQVLVQQATTGNLPSQSRHSSDWSSISDSDSDNALPLNPKNTIKFYKQSIKKLKKKLAGGRDAASSDSEGDVDHRVGRVLESSQAGFPDSSRSALTGSSHPHLRAHSKRTRTRSFQFAHPVLRDVLGEPLPPKEEVKLEENMAPPPDFWGCYHELDLAAFFELHHLDVPVSYGKRRGRRVHQQSGTKGQRSKQMIVQKEEVKPNNNPERIDGQLDHMKSRPPTETANPPPPMKKKAEFHQGALNQFDAKEGTHRLSWRDRAPISRKAQFFEVEAEIANETTAPSEEKRKLSTLPDTTASRRISLFEGMALH